MLLTTLLPIESSTHPELADGTTTPRSSTVPDPVASWSERGLNPDRIDALRDRVQGPFLDVGCGTGAYVLHGDLRFPSYGCDVRRFDAWAANPVRFSIADAARLPFRDASFDTVSCFETIEHLPAPLPAIRELARVSRRLVIVTVPNCDRTEGMRRSGLVYAPYVDPTHVNFLDLPALVSLLEEAGLDVREARLINRLNLAPFLAEALALPTLVGRILGRVNRRFGRVYQMTSLAVCEIRPSPAQEM
jgi:SAM-dependent methyltransferase